MPLPLPYPSHKLGPETAQYQHQPMPGPSRSHGNLDDGKREKKRKDISGKLGKEMNDRRDDGRHYSENISALHSLALQLSTRPETVSIYMLRLMPLSIERSALLAQIETEERYALESTQIAYDEERERVEEEWKRGRDRVREKLIEGIEERRKRAREDKEGEGTSADAALDSHSRSHITRKLRNKLGTSPPPTPLGSTASALPNGVGLVNTLPITSGPFLNPHSLAVEEIPSPYPLALTSTAAPAIGSSTVASSGATTSAPSGRRRPKGSGTHQSQAVGGLGKSLLALAGCRDPELEADLLDIRRGGKRRRTAAQAMAKAAS